MEQVLVGTDKDSKQWLSNDDPREGVKTVLQTGD